jgi:phosphoglycerate dehydrogenase-like enzyme
MYNTLKEVERMKMIFIASGSTYNERMLSPIMTGELNKLGELRVLTRGSMLDENERAAKIRACDILLTGWGSSPAPESIANDRGNLKYILNITGSVRGYIEPCHIAAGIPVTNWGDAQAASVAEGAMALLMSAMKNIRPLGKLIESGYWGAGGLPFASLHKLRVSIYGMGAIGRKFVEYIVPYEPILTGFDPYVNSENWPDSVRRVNRLEALFDGADCLVIHAGLSDETRRTVTAELLSKLPDGGIVINTARGGIIDQSALMEELRTGRLRAGLDVLDSPEAGDMLLLNDPARSFVNLVLTCHHAGNRSWPQEERLELFHEVALDNIRRFIAGEPLRFTMDLERFHRST